MTKSEILIAFNPDYGTDYETAEECEDVNEALLNLGWDGRYSTLSDFIDEYEGELKTAGVLQFKEKNIVHMITPQEATRIAIEKCTILQQNEFIKVMEEIYNASQHGNFNIYVPSLYPNTEERLERDGWVVYRFPNGQVKISWPESDNV